MIYSVGVIGAGNMGSGIAQKFAQEGFEVILVDTTLEFVNHGFDTIKAILGQATEKKLYTSEQVDGILARITCSTDLAAVKDADLVVEAIFENRQAKEELFKGLDDLCKKQTILATNTSSFSINDFSKKISRPDRFVGLHYFYHPAKNRLLEVIPNEETSKKTIDTVLLAAKRHGKTAILVTDSPGFVVNRFFVPFLNEAARMLEEGLADIRTIEAVAKKTFRIGMGPFELMNVTGIPIAVHAATTLGEELGPFYAPCGVLKAQMEKNRDWDLAGMSDEPIGDQSAAGQMAAANHVAAADQVADRFIGVCCGVAAALVDEGAAAMEDIDRGAKIGLRWALGPFEIMNRIGVDKAFAAVESICRRYPDFTMPECLKRQKELKKAFQFQWVDLEIRESLAVITINRPEAMNALNESVVSQLDELFTRAEKDPAVAAILIRGAGKAFVAGADIGYFIHKIKSGKVADIARFTRKGHELLLRIENSSTFTIVLLDGLSLGGGSELALAAQAVIATDAGSMGFPETGIGIYPGLGGMLRFARWVGPELAKYYTFTGTTLKAQDLFDLGIATALVRADQVENTVTDLMAKGVSEKYGKRPLPERFKAVAALCSERNSRHFFKGEPLENVDADLGARYTKTLGFKAPIALKIAGEIIDAQQGRGIKEAVEIELGRLEEIFTTKDALEGLSSAGRRRPGFKGE